MTGNIIESEVFLICKMLNSYYEKHNKLEKIITPIEMVTIAKEFKINQKEENKNDNK